MIKVIALVSTSVIDKNTKLHTGFHLPGGNVAYAEEDDE